jgi:tRNA(adenine34) deaminase
MRQALDEARSARARGDVPVGAVLVSDGGVVRATAGNERELRRDPTAHAEVVALRAAAQVLGDWRLLGTTMYVTLEPCVMCGGALVGARVRRLVYGCQDPRGGGASSLYNVVQDPRLEHALQVTHGVLAQESADLLRGFFEDRRRL